MATAAPIDAERTRLLLERAERALKTFLAAQDAQNKARQNGEKYKYIAERLAEVRQVLEERVTTPVTIGPVADARNLYWDEPVSAEEKNLLDRTFELFHYLREQGYGHK